MVRAVARRQPCLYARAYRRGRPRSVCVRDRTAAATRAPIAQAVS